MTNITIVSDIPLPTRKKSSRPEKYAFMRNLKVGDSVWLPITPAASAVHARKLAKELGWKMVVRVEETGSRVWRSK